MSQHIVDQFSRFRNYKLCTISKNFTNQRPSTIPDINELLEIVAILETHEIKYELTSQFDLRYL